LKGVPYVDVTGLSVKLDQVIAQVDTLPLARDERIEAPPRPPSNAQDPAWIRFLRDTWGDIRSVIRIETTQRPAPPLITPQEAYFLRENMRLRLLAARMALLSRDEKGYKADLDETLKWIDRYFDTRAKPVVVVSAAIAQAKSIAMPTEMPDLNRTLDAVRTLRASADRADEKATDRTPASGGAAPLRPR